MKIALICAFPDLANSGMLSVDLAFESLKKYINPNIEIVRFCSWKDITREGTVYLHYRHLSHVSQLEEFDRIVYWGDFLHWCKYGPNFMSSKGTEWYANENNITIKEANDILKESWYSMYLLEGRKDLQKKSIIFGGTIYGIDSDQISNSRYQSALSSLYENAILVLMRDYISAFYVSQLFDDKRFSYGCDCALFLESFNEEKIISDSDPYMVYSFGRCKSTPELEDFAHDIAKKNNVKAVKVPWLDAQTTVDRLLNNISVIKNSQFAVTDIYHFAINSWRERVPTFTVGRGNSYPSQGTLADKKKEIFNTQIMAMNYYFYLENILSDREKYVQHSISQIRNKPAFEIILEKIKTHINYSMNRLIGAINN